MLFLNRADAGRHLAQRLRHLRGTDVAVLGLPRGGVPVAFEVAEELRAPLDVIVVRKLGVPFQPEYGFGAIGEGGVRVIDEHVTRLRDGQPHLNHPDMAALPAARQAAELDQMSAEQRAHHRHRAVRVPAAPRRLRPRHAQARAAAPDGRVAMVGRHPGLDGRRFGLLLLGTPHHPAGRAGGRRPAHPIV